MNSVREEKVPSYCLNKLGYWFNKRIKLLQYLEQQQKFWEASMVNYQKLKFVKNHSYFSEVFVNQVILWFQFRVYLQFTPWSWRTFMFQMFRHFCLLSGPSLNINTLLISYLLSTINITNVLAILLVFFWNPNHKLICAPSAGYLLLQLKQSITEIHINCVNYGDIREISTEKNLYWNRKKLPSN